MTPFVGGVMAAKKFCRTTALPSTAFSADVPGNVLQMRVDCSAYSVQTSNSAMILRIAATQHTQCKAM